MSEEAPQQLPHVVIHTDGGCSPNPGPGGWAAILTFGDHEKELTGDEANTTNNRMELMAAISALEALKRPCRVDLHTDSQYLRNGVTAYLPRWKQNGWRTADKKPVKNIDLWQRLDAAMRQHQIRWHWLRGHAGHAMNERADVLVGKMIAEVRAQGRATNAASSDDANTKATTTVELVSKWATQTHNEIGSGGIFLFGSLIYRAGAQFTEVSDVDVVVLFPADYHVAPQRADWLERLRDRKQALEADLSAHLGRPNVEKPICSMVVATQVEVAADIHKDGSAKFFSKNQFRDLLTGNDIQGLPDAGKKIIREQLAIECLRFVQRKRNAFLSVAPNGAGGLPTHENGDPLPKDVMRHAAMAWSLRQKDAPPGAEYDTEEGLNFLSNVLYQDRKIKPYASLHNELSVRRGARGVRAPLSARQQLLFAELIFDLVAKYLADDEARKKVPRIDSTSEFSHRFSQAFPGVRGIAWFDNPQDIKERLKILLQKPLVYPSSQPIWWWRDGNMPIESFEEIEDEFFLMDDAELKIRRIAAVNPGPYDRCFVYVEVDAMPPTGLYEKTAERIAEVERGEGAWSYDWEEYAIVEGGHLVTRAEHDDGAAVIDGRPADIRGKNKLRIRYVTPYNFVIAAHGSPINNTAFDNQLAQLLDRMLRGEDALPDLAKAVLKLPKRQNLGGG